MTNLKLVPATVLLLASTATSSAQQTRTTWKDYLGGPDSSHYSALKQINTGNVNKLEVAWSYPTGDDTSYTFSPLVAGNVAYFAAKQGSLVAVDAATGKELWVYTFPSASGAAGRFSGISGQLLWVFHTIPRPGEFGYDTWPKDAYKYMGGVDVWGEITVDEKRGIVYLPTASAKYELYGGDRKGDNLFADCLLALDARTGKRLWHYQTVHHDLWDYDPDAAPQLVTVKHEGKTVDAVALASKNGFLFVFDRVTGKPLWPIEERPVPPSDVPGEVAAKTQPFPTVVAPFARQS